jgi:hypothetical protein
VEEVVAMTTAMMVRRTTRMREKEGDEGRRWAQRRWSMW